MPPANKHPQGPARQPRVPSYAMFQRIKGGIDDAALRAAGLPPAEELTYDTFVKSFLWTGAKDGAKLAPPPLGPHRDELGQNDMSASAKDLPDADLEKIIRDKHRQAQTSRPQMGLSAEPGLNPHRMTDDPPLRRADPLGPTLTVDPADRVYAAGGASRGQGRLGMVIIALVAAALVGGIFLWSQRGSEVAAVAPSPVPTPTPAPSPVDAATSNATITDPAVQPAASAAPTAAAPTTTPSPAPTPAPAAASAPAAPVVAAPAETDANKVSAPAATEKTTAEKAVTEKAATEKATTEKAATQKSTTEKKVEKPAAAPATTEKKKKKAAATTTATVKPKPAATDSSDENFSTLLKSLTTEDAAPSSPAEPPVQQPSVQQPSVQQPAAAQPATTQKSGAPLPSSTAPSTPGSQLFTP